MVKGVNKNIIEITDTGNEDFERVILFVRADRPKGADGEDLGARARSYIAGLRVRRGILRRRTRGLLLLKVAGILALVAAVALLALKI